MFEISVLLPEGNVDNVVTQNVPIHFNFLRICNNALELFLNNRYNIRQTRGIVNKCGDFFYAF